MATDFHVEKSVEGNALVLRLRGELDIATADDLITAFEEADGDAGSVTVDLTELEFIDSSGIRAVLTIKRRCDDLGRSMVLISGGPAVDRVIRLVRLEDNIEVVRGRPAG